MARKSGGKIEVGLTTTTIATTSIARSANYRLKILTFTFGP